MSALLLEDQATGEVAEIYKEIKAHFGMVPNFFKAQAALDVAWLEINWKRWKWVMGQERDLDRKTKELIATAISISNQCQYCSLAHETAALMAGSNEREVMEMKQIVELFASFNQIANSLKIPCDLTPDAISQEQKAE